MIMKNTESNIGQMLNGGYQVLNTIDGIIYHREWIIGDDDLPIGTKFPVDITSKEFIEVPIIQPYLRKQFLSKLSYSYWDLARYGLSRDICPDKFTYCSCPNTAFFSAMYSHQVSLLFQEVYPKELGGHSDAEDPFWKYAREQAPALIREWCDQQGIFLV